MRIKKNLFAFVGFAVLLGVTACASRLAPLLTPAAESGTPSTAPQVSPETPTQSNTLQPGASAEAVPPDSGAQRRFVLLAEQSSAAYHVQEEFLSGAIAQLGIDAGNQITIGITRDLSGELIFSTGERLQLVAAEFTANLQTLESDDSRRDNQIRRRYLESNRFPEARFVAIDVLDAPASYLEGEMGSFQLVGDLTVREITQRITLQVNAVLQGERIEGTARAELKMSDFGFSPPNFANVFVVQDEFEIVLEFTLAEQSG